LEKVVITGANGFVGSHLVEYLLSKGYEVHCILRKSSSTKWIKDLPIFIHTCGLNNVELLRPILTDAHYIYHIAGVVKEKNWAGYEYGNVSITKNILEATLGSNTIKRIVVTASLACSAPAELGHPVSEDTPSNPLTYYGKSKLLQEQLTLGYADRLPVTVIRPPVVFGEREIELYEFYKAIKMHLFPSIGLDEKYLSLVYIADLVRGMHLAATSEKALGQQYFIGGDQEEYSWKEIARLTGQNLNSKYIRLKIPHFLVHIIMHISEFFSKIFGYTTMLNVQKANEMVQTSWSCSSAKANRDFGYKAEYTLEQGLRRTIGWCKKEGWL
jgi:dihydroflavonol-4-reductase